MNAVLRRTAFSLLATVVLAGLLAGCGRSSSSGTAGTGKFEVVAAENFWGSIASQLAGTKATVSSIIVHPSTDPHSYEPTAQDARTIAGARMAIANGVAMTTG